MKSDKGHRYIKAPHDLPRKKTNKSLGNLTLGFLRYGYRHKLLVG